MGENLVIVESPTKEKTLKTFLGKDFTVKASIGHIRDLSEKKLSIDVKNGFTPVYEIPAKKKKVVAELAAEAKKAQIVWLASDEDREGEAIAWHLAETLKLDPARTRRIAFHEITKTAILNAIDNPREIDMNLVMAQQARRVLDRLVGFELSPVLWKKVQRGLSAGRVQSVALRLIVDREREIEAFKPEPFFKVEAIFTAKGVKQPVKALLDKKFTDVKEALGFLEKCRNAEFRIRSIEKKEGTRTPAAPFTTSSLQQEAARKLGFSVSQTMTTAQTLYERGLITYMRTDSTNLSTLALGTTKDTVIKLYGQQYSKVRNYQTKVKGAQEAHEAIRPTFVNNTDIEGSPAERKLYNLIWKRCVASQMADAKIEKTAITIEADGLEERFIAQGEVIVFDGFLKVYRESFDDVEDEEAVKLPALDQGASLTASSITATERFTQKPPRYSEASLVKKIEELGIGRPSTYEPTVKTIQKRGYVTKGDKEGTPREYTVLSLKDGVVAQRTESEITGAEKKKLLPENIGMVVTDFLAANFADILDYGFTAKVEEDLDKIESGKIPWNRSIAEFYDKFIAEVGKSLEDKSYTNAKRELGTDPASGKPVIARIGKFGPLVQKGSNDDPEKQFISLPKGVLIENVTLEEALKLFELPRLPRNIGSYKGLDIVASTGRFGPYIKYDGKFISIGKGGDPFTITEEEAVALIEAAARKSLPIADFKDSGIQVLHGRYGAYIKQGGNNYKIPKGVEAESLTESQCLEIIAAQDKK
ncbi:MAG: type I DNA topoisomerase [Bacteroidales bacterium]|nr:type I DNA topoisomerase [Candidatus Cacconaster merdequi]